MTGPKYPNAQTEVGWFATILDGLLNKYGLMGSSRWWIGAAMDTIGANHAQLITSRDGTVVYMLRCWLSPPMPTTAGQHAKYESGNAELLHWILQPDDIPHLHNHPWEFTTRILAGGYAEDYQTPMGDVVSVSHSEGGSAKIIRTLDDFHRIASHFNGPGDPYTGQGGTWSLVTTGPRVQPWSFLIDGQQVDAETFLREKA